MSAMVINDIKKDGLFRDYYCQIPSSALNKSIDLYLISIPTKINGFRTGKSVKNLPDEKIRVLGQKLRSIYKDKLDVIAKEVIEKAVYQQIMLNKIEVPAYSPEIKMDHNCVDVIENYNRNHHSIDNDQIGDFSVSFEVMPSDVPMEFSIEKLEKNVSKINDEDVNVFLTKHAKEVFRYVEVDEDYQYQLNDYAKINLSAVYREEIHDLLKDFEVKDGSLMPQFLEKMIGMTIGKSAEIDFQMPDAFQYRKLAGKLVKYQIEILSIKSRKYFDFEKDADEFAKHSGFENVEKMKEKFKELLQGEADRLSNAIFEKRAKAVLLEQLNFAVPKKILEDAEENIRNEHAQSSDEDIDIASIALNDVRFSIFVSQFANKNVSISNMELNFMNYQFQGKYSKEELKDMLIRAKVMKKVTESVKEIVEKDVAFEELQSMAK